MKKLFSLVVILAVQAVSSAQSPWIEDLEVYHQELEKKHIDLYKNISKADFQAEVNRIQTESAERSDTQTILDLMRLTRKIGDGHTAFSLRGVATHNYPIEVYLVDGNWRVIRVSKAHEELLGQSLKSIDGMPIEQVMQQVAPVAQYVENEQSKTIRSAQYMQIAELLHGLGITKAEQKAGFGFVQDNGKKTTVQLTALADTNQIDFVSFKTEVPQIHKPENAELDYLWFSPIAQTNAIYIQFASYPSFEQMQRFGTSVLTYINQNQTEQVVIDLRNNGGGDFFIGTYLAYYLNLADSIDWKNGVYLLTDKVTFSAATSNAAQFRQMLNAKVIGEPTGSNPTGYQDMGEFELPNSGMVVTYSKRFFRFQAEVTSGVRPDVFIPYDWEAYSNGRDNMLEWVLDRI